MEFPACFLERLSRRIQGAVTSGTNMLLKERPQWQRIGDLLSDSRTTQLDAYLREIACETQKLPAA